LISGGASEADDSKEDSKKDSKEDDSKEEEKDTSEEEDSEDDADEGSGEIPEGVEVITMPRLSDTMEEGTVATWLKQEGDQVEEGDILAEIETDKATMEFESFYEGVLLHIALEEGESSPVDDVLAIIGPEGTDVDQVLKSLKSGGSEKKAKKEKDSDKKDTEKEESTAKSSESSSKEESSEKETEGKDGSRIFASPLARRMAEDKGIDLSDVKGSGENGRIVKKDIENYKPSEKAAEKPAVAAAQTYVPAGEESFEEVKNSQMRKTIAKRLSASKFTAPHYYLTIEVDMDNAISSRKAINNMPDTRVSFNDMVIKASAMALRKHPQVNSQWEDNVTKIAEHIHVGVAVAVEDGLVVPVLPFADQMSMTQIGGN